jgi:hypothetical protein
VALLGLEEALTPDRRTSLTEIDSRPPHCQNFLEYVGVGGSAHMGEGRRREPIRMLSLLASVALDLVMLDAEARRSDRQRCGD